MKRILGFIVLLFFSISLVAPAAVQAQGVLVFDRLEVQFWPEYDRPGVLVIYHITLSPQTSLPAQLQFNLPVDVEKPEMVAYHGWDGILYDLDFSIIPAGDQILLTFTTPFPEIQIEYYDPNIIQEDNLYQFTYHWFGDYTIENLSMIFQQPLNSSNFEILQSFFTTINEIDGMTYFTANLGRITAGYAFDVDFSYRRTSSGFSTPLLPVHSSSALTLENLPNRWASDTFLPSRFTHQAGWLAGVVTLGSSLALAATIFLVSGMALPWVSRVKLGVFRHREEKKDGGASISTEEPDFCQQCGRKAQSGDVFCRSCGTRYQTE